MRYHHAFDGDGMVQAFRFTAAGVSHLGRYVETAKYRRETAAGKALEQGFGTVLPEIPPPPDTVAVNVANINILVHGGRLLALWEGGDAYTLDATTLDTLGPHFWSTETSGVPFSAHPKVEADGTLWNFGVFPSLGQLVLYRISPTGQLADVATMPVDRLGMVHDFVVTARHLVLVLPPLVYDRERAVAGQSYLDSHSWRPDLPARLLILEKGNLARARWVELPSQWLFHFGNAWEEDNGTIHFDYCRYDDPAIMFQTLRYVMQGEWRETRWGCTTCITVDPAGKVYEERLSEQEEFPCIDPRRVGVRHHQLYTLLRRPQAAAHHPLFNAIARRDLTSGALDMFAYEPSVIPEEHIVVPRSYTDQEGDGWVIGTSLDVARRVTQVAVFDALHLSDGPLAVASLPYALPFGFHGTFALA
jgi:carotenoid cleavage dioxygenase